MTQQIKEKLIYKGRLFRMESYPLDSYFSKQNIQFKHAATFNYRGYIGTWSIEDEKVYLVKFNWFMRAPEDIDASEKEVVADLFRGREKVFAEWFTGEIKTFYGKRLFTSHLGLIELYRHELIFTIEKGVVISKKRKLNTILDVMKARKKAEILFD